MRKFILIFLVLLMTVTVSTLKEEPQSMNYSSLDGTSSFPIGLSKLLLEDARKDLEAKAQVQEKAIFQSDGLNSIALPIGYVGAVDAITLIKREAVLEEKRQEVIAELEAERIAKEKAKKAEEEALFQAALEAQKREEDARLLAEQAKLAALVQAQMAKNEIISNEIAFENESVNRVDNSYQTNFILKNLGEELRSGSIEFVLYFQDDKAIPFVENGAYKFRRQVPKDYTLNMTEEMLSYAKSILPAFISIALVDDAGETILRKNIPL